MGTKEETDITEICIQQIVDGKIDVSNLIREIETGVMHKEDDTYIVDNRWTIKITPERDIVLVSEEFMKSITAATYSVPHEWGGLIFGRVIPFTPDINIFICERVAIMAQNRSSAEFEIKDEHYQAWVKTEEFDNFIKSGWKRIGWVHSHVNMGCFWSGTDDTTIKQLIAEQVNDAIISVVVSKRQDKKLDVYYRPSNRGGRNGTQYLIPDVKTTIPEEQVYLEEEMSSYDDLDEDYREMMKEKMDKTEVIESVTTVTTYQGQSPYYSWGRVWGAQETQYADTKGNLDIPNFALLASQHSNEMRVLLEKELSGKRWKMKHLVKTLADGHKILLYKMLRFFLTYPQKLQRYLYIYKNLDELADLFKVNVQNLINNPSYEFLKIHLTSLYNHNWPTKFENNIKKKTYKTTSSQTTLTQPSVIRENISGWDKYLEKIDEKMIRKTLDALMKVKGPMFFEVFKKIIEAFEWRVRGEEEKWSIAFAMVYKNLKDVKFRKNVDKEAYQEFLIRLLGEAFKGFRGATVKAKKALQHTLNHLPDELVLPFLYDFVVEFETEEELDGFYKEGLIPVRRKMYECPYCNNFWSTRGEMEKCKKVCKKIQKDKDKTKLDEAEEVVPKVMAVETRVPVEFQKTEGTNETTAMGTYGRDGTFNPLDTSCGMPLDYWENANICPVCGLQYEFESNVNMCLKNHREDEHKLIWFVIKTMGFYVCPQCSEVLVDMEEVVNHSLSCEMYGSLLHAVLRTFCITNDSHLTLEGGESLHGYPAFPDYDSEAFEEMIFEYYPWEMHMLPPILKYLYLKLRNHQLPLICSYCDLSFENEFDALEGAYACFRHESCCSHRQCDETFTPEKNETGCTEAVFQLKPSSNEALMSIYTCQKCGTNVGVPVEMSEEEVLELLREHYVIQHNLFDGAPICVLRC